jgi:hypothetical protein
MVNPVIVALTLAVPLRLFDCAKPEAVIVRIVSSVLAQPVTFDVKSFVEWSVYVPIA